MFAAGTQWRTTGFGVVGLDMNAVLAIAGVLEIHVDALMLSKIKAIEMIELERMNRKDESDGC